MSRFLYAISFLLLPFLGHSSTYNLKDLELLKEEKNYSEFFAHAFDLRPSERGQEWKKMLEEIVEEYADNYLKKTEVITPVVIQQLVQISSWPSVKDNNFFIHKKNQIIQSYFYKKALQKKEPPSQILEEMQKTLQAKDLKDANFAIEMAKIKMQLGVSPLEIYPLIQNPLRTEYASFYCTDPSITPIVLQKLVAELTLSPEKELSMRREKIISPDCWKKMTPKLLQDLTSPSLFTREEAALLLKSDKAFQEKKGPTWDLYAVLSFLDAPPLGETRNFAWNRLKSFAKNFKYRETLLNSLKHLDPLPSALFEKNKSEQVMIEHLVTFFPEYVSWYALNCQKYRKGEQKNTTPSCSAFLQDQNVRNFLGDYQLKQF
ncbi:MAG: hypothetical protein KBD63_06370 [Bacteriovoracaceae bacterium]|nr:hypothetical protein [Bacteriovoracaceae bacterium]